MVAHPVDTADVGSLQSLGIGQAEENVYGVLLDHPGAKTSEICRRSKVSSARAKRLLESLEQLGLVVCSVDRVRRYFPVDPNLAIEALILKRKEELEYVRTTIPRLRERAMAAADTGNQEIIVEIISGKQLQKQLLGQMEYATKKEFLCMERQPYITTTPEALDEIALGMAKQGIVFRNLIDPAVLEISGVLERLRIQARYGEIIRVFPNLPTKLLISDRRVGLIPLNLDHPDGPVLLVRPSALLDALYTLFEFIWDRATPLSFASSGAPVFSEPKRRFPVDADKLTQFLAAGVNDKKSPPSLECPCARWKGVSSN